MKIGQCWKFKHGNLSTNPFRTCSGVERAGQQVRRAHSRDSFCAPFTCQRISQAEAAQTPSQRRAALGFLGISPEALASPLQHIFAFSRRRKTVATHVWPKERWGAQGTNKCEGIITVWVSQTAYTEAGKAGTGEPSCHPGVPGEGLCPGPRYREQGGE